MVQGLASWVLWALRAGADVPVQLMRVGAHSAALAVACLSLSAPRGLGGALPSCLRLAGRARVAGIARGAGARAIVGLAVFNGCAALADVFVFGLPAIVTLRAGAGRSQTAGCWVL